MGGVGLGVFGGACMAHKNASGARFPHTGFQKLGTITLIGTTGVSLGLLTGSICYHAIDEILDLTCFLSGIMTEAGTNAMGYTLAPKGDPNPKGYPKDGKEQQAAAQAAQATAQATGAIIDSKKLVQLIPCDINGHFTCKICYAIAFSGPCPKVKCENCAGMGFREGSCESKPPQPTQFLCTVCEGKKVLAVPCISCVECAKAIEADFDAYVMASVAERNQEHERRWVLFTKAKRTLEKRSHVIELSGCELQKPPAQKS
jgi:hypothetical protein